MIDASKPNREALNAAALLASRTRTSDAPWSSGRRIGVLTTNVICAAVLVACWFGTAETASIDTEKHYLELAVAALIVTGAIDASLLLRGRQAVSLATAAVLACSAWAPTAGLAALVDATDDDVRVHVPGTTRLHRPLCLLALGKETIVVDDRDHPRLQRCEICEA
jgi:hypothetical protein